MSRGRAALITWLATCLWACGGPPPVPVEGYEDLASRAARLARELILVDTHIDVAYRLSEKPEDISQRTEGGDFDWVRARAGGLDAAFMSIYVPARYQSEGGARAKADDLIDMVEGFERRWPDRFAIARSAEDVRRNHAAGLLSLPMGIENGAAVEDDLANLEHFWSRGVRYVTLTHAENNQICDSSYETEPTWNGLSPFGREVVAELNRLGVMIDISHVTDATVRQVLELTRAPVIASHSSCRHFTPGWQRNIDDDLIRAVAARGGVIHINFGSAFLTEASNRMFEEMWEQVNGYMEEHGLAEGDEEVTIFRERYFAEHPPVLADVVDVADHIDHVVGLVGVEHVGIGSDFDGVGPSTPTGLEDVSQYPNLIRILLERGYTDEEIGSIFGGNTLRVWEEVERVAAEL